MKSFFCLFWKSSLRWIQIKVCFGPEKQFWVFRFLVSISQFFDKYCNLPAKKKFLIFESGCKISTIGCISCSYPIDTISRSTDWLKESFFWVTLFLWNLFFTNRFSLLMILCLQTGCLMGCSNFDILNDAIQPPFIQMAEDGAF